MTVSLSSITTTTTTTTISTAETKISVPPTSLKTSTTSTMTIAIRQPFSYIPHKQQVFPLPVEICTEILSHLGRDTLWDFAWISPSCYALAFPLLFSRLVLGYGKQRVYYGDYDGVCESSGRHKLERKELAEELGWEDNIILRHDLHMMEIGKEVLSQTVKTLHFNAPTFLGPPELTLLDQTFDLLAGMRNLRWLSVNLPLGKHEHNTVTIESNDGKPEQRLTTQFHHILKHLSNLKALTSLDLDLRMEAFANRQRSWPHIAFADAEVSPANLRSLCVRYAGWELHNGETCPFDVTGLLISFLLKNLLANSKDSLHELRLILNNPWPLTAPRCATAAMQRIESLCGLDFDLGDIISPQLRVLHYGALQQQWKDGTNLVEPLEMCSRRSTISTLPRWFPNLRSLRVREEYKALKAVGWDLRPREDGFIVSPFELETYSYNFDSICELKKLESLDIALRWLDDDEDVELQPDYDYFRSMLQSPSQAMKCYEEEIDKMKKLVPPVEKEEILKRKRWYFSKRKNKYRAERISDNEDDSESEQDDNSESEDDDIQYHKSKTISVDLDVELEADITSVKKLLLPEAISRALSLRLPRLREVRWGSTRSHQDFPSSMCSFQVSGGDLIKSTSQLYPPPRTWLSPASGRDGLLYLSKRTIFGFKR